MSMKHLKIAFVSALMFAGFSSPSFSADCLAIGQQQAAENGGTLTKADVAMRDGKEVCVVVVLVPGKNGERPKRLELVVAAQ